MPMSRAALLPSLTASLVVLLCAGRLAAADQVVVDAGVPVGTTFVVSPLTIEEAQKWVFFSQVIVVKEKEGVLIDTADAKNQMLIVQSMSYFKGASGQLFAVVNYLRPRTPAK